MSDGSRPKVGSNKKTKEDQRKLITVIILLIIVAFIAIYAFVATRSKTTSGTLEDNPRINPVGREASSEYTENTDDPEIRASEEEKLSTVLALISEKDWEHANVLFETIFPSYLDTCGEYNYYQAAKSLSENYRDFQIEFETVKTRLNALSSHCSDAKGK